MDSKTVLDIISTTEDLEALYLKGIPGITVDDIKAMIDSAKKLDVLTVKQCNFNSKDIITFIRNRTRKFKHVKIDDFNDDDYEDPPKFRFDAFD